MLPQALDVKVSLIIMTKASLWIIQKICSNKNHNFHLICFFDFFYHVCSIYLLWIHDRKSNDSAGYQNLCFENKKKNSIVHTSFTI